MRTFGQGYGPSKGGVNGAPTFKSQKTDVSGSATTKMANLQEAPSGSRGHNELAIGGGSFQTPPNFPETKNKFAGTTAAKRKDRRLG